MKTILFQGDSITDCGRGDGLGTGYALLCTAQIGRENPGQYNFIILDGFVAVLIDLGGIFGHHHAGEPVTGGDAAQIAQLPNGLHIDRIRSIAAGGKR